MLFFGPMNVRRRCSRWFGLRGEKSVADIGRNLLLDLLSGFRSHYGLPQAGKRCGEFRILRPIPLWLGHPIQNDINDE